MLTGCISTTRLNSSDPEATVVSPEMGASEIGTLVHRDRKMFFATTEIKIEKAGCKTAYYEIKKNDEFAVEGFLGGFYTFGIGWLWITNYLPEYNLNFKCEKAAANEKK